jgi:hypothetical protein
MALTKVAQLTLATLGTIATGASAGTGFGNVTGSDFLKRRYGPGITNGDKGWSIRFNKTFPYTKVTGLPTTAGTTVVPSFWYYLVKLMLHL